LAVRTFKKTVNVNLSLTRGTSGLRSLKKLVANLSTYVRKKKPRKHTSGHDGTPTGQGCDERHTTDLGRLWRLPRERTSLSRVRCSQVRYRQRVIEKEK